VADPWVSLLIGGTILLVGFAAHLAFQRYHIPDFLVLIVLGTILGQLPIPPFGPGLLSSLSSLLPLFLQLTVAFILFEGGLSLKLRQTGRALGPLIAHIVGSFALTLVLVWFLGTRVFGLGDTGALVFAAAIAGPSASMALSFGTRMHLSERAEAGVVLEGVLTNVMTVMAVLYLIQGVGVGTGASLIAYSAGAAGAAAFAAAVGVVWRLTTQRLSGKEFLYIASLAVAVVVYAVTQGLLLENGAVAVFVFGVILGYRRRMTVEEQIDEFVGVFSRPAERLRGFQSEITFALRTFFFVYLGLLLVSEWGGFETLLAGALVTLAFVAGRAPTALAAGRVLRLPRREQRVLIASMGRGMTDVILVLLAVESGILPAAEASFLLRVLPAMVVLSAFVCAGLLMWAARTPAPAPAAASPLLAPPGRAATDPPEEHAE
jgi:cell volume regulation protein A